MQVQEIMSRDLEYVAPQASIEEVARRMREQNAGTILVGDGQRMEGVITDHDIVTKVLAEGRDPASVKVSEIMTSPVISCPISASAEEVADKMEDEQVLRMLVMDQDNKPCGIVAHSDIADAVVKQRLFNEPLAQKVVELASKVAA